MTDSGNIATWNVLKEFGFAPDHKVISDEMPGLSFDFGNFKLSAGAAMGKGFRPVVLFTGLLATQRTLADVSFELPRELASRELLAAWLVYSLDGASNMRGFQPEEYVDWMAIGRQHIHLLPWEVERAAYNLRPQCMVQREWLRVALKNLAEILAEVKRTVEVEFGFDGTILTIQCCEEVLPMPAQGKRWPVKFTVSAENMRQLPNRLTRPRVAVEVYKGRLRIANRGYDVMERAS